MMISAFVLDKYYSSLGDFGFWLYLYGLITFTSGKGNINIEFSGIALDFGVFDDADESSGNLYLFIHIALIGFGTYLDRHMFFVFGALPIASYYVYSVVELRKVTIHW